jgi:hypothetical protein
MKKVKLTKREIETLLWTIEEHKNEVMKRLKTEEDLMTYRLLFDYNMHLRGLADKLERSMRSSPGIPIKIKEMDVANLQ